MSVQTTGTITIDVSDYCIVKFRPNRPLMYIQVSSDGPIYITGPGFSREDGQALQMTPGTAGTVGQEYTEVDGDVMVGAPPVAIVPFSAKELTFRITNPSASAGVSAQLRFFTQDGHI